MSSSSYLITLGADSVNTPVTVLPGQLKDVSHLKLVGRGAQGYGLAYAQNFASLLCNFASDTTPPPNPVVGQIWYNDSEKRLKVRTANGWSSIYGEGGIIPIASGGTGTNALNAPGQIVRVKSPVNPNDPPSLECVPLNTIVGTTFVRTDSDSQPSSDNLWSVGTQLKRFKEIHSVSFKGNADTSTLSASATKLQNTRTISLQGDASGTVNFDGSANASITTSIPGIGNFRDAVIVNANTTLTVNDFGKFYQTTSGGPWTFTIPTAAGQNGKKIMVWANSAQTLNLTVSGCDFIGPNSSGTSNQTVQAYSLMTLVSDGFNWVVSSTNAQGLGYVPVNKAGDYMSGSLVVVGGNNFTAGTPGSSGQARLIGLNPGSAYTGRVEFIGSNDIRAGFIGNAQNVGSTDAGTLTYCGSVHNFTGSINLTGSLYAWGNVTAFSDERLKKNIKKIDSALEKVKRMNGVTYERSDINDGVKHTGLIAQNVKEVMPEAVSESNGYLSVAYGNLVGLLIEAIKEQQETIEMLKAKINGD